jgi:hypothetical protein
MNSTCSKGHTTFASDRYCAECGEPLAKKRAMTRRELIVVWVILVALAIGLMVGEYRAQQAIASYKKTFLDHGCFVIEGIFEPIDAAGEAELKELID